MIQQCSHQIWCRSVHAFKKIPIPVLEHPLKRTKNLSLIINNSAADWPILLKFGTYIDHTIPDLPQKFKVNHKIDITTESSKFTSKACDDLSHRCHCHGSRCHNAVFGGFGEILELWCRVSESELRYSSLANLNRHNQIPTSSISRRHTGVGLAY